MPDFWDAPHGFWVGPKGNDTIEMKPQEQMADKLTEYRFPVPEGEVSRGRAHGLSQRAFNGPPKMQALMQRLEFDARCFRPRNQRHGSTIVGQEDVGSPISLLFRPRAPLHIAGFVSTIVIDPIDTVKGRRTRTNIGKELCERIPLRADSDTPPTIVRVLGVARIHAASTQLKPRGVFGRPTGPRGLPVLGGSRSRHVLTQAAARLCSSLAEAEPSNRERRATVTLADPVDAPIGLALRIFGKDKQSAESLAGHGNLRGHQAHSLVSAPVVVPTRRGTLLP